MTKFNTIRGLATGYLFPKFRELWSWGFHYTMQRQCISPSLMYLFYKCSAVAEVGNRLAVVDMGRKLGAVPLMGELDPYVTQCWLV